MATKSRSKKQTSSKAKAKTPKPAEGALSGKIALVTGGGRGLGRAMAEALAREGATVIITGRDEEQLALSAVSIGAGGGIVLSKHCELRKPESVAALFTAIRQQFGRLDILINNAGVAGPMANVDQLSLEAWSEVVDINLTGLFLVTHAALPLMHPGATIVNNLSISAKTAFPGMAAYNASKMGALGFTETLRKEVRSRGIRVIALIPGATNTDIWEQFWPEAPRERMLAPQSVAKMVLAALKLPEESTVSELEITPTAGEL
jgi:NAD(P)-dependent dehydrogenase (short-subunit alcohol dehydrogenase family)